MFDSLPYHYTLDPIYPPLLLLKKTHKVWQAITKQVRLSVSHRGRGNDVLAMRMKKKICICVCVCVCVRISYAM